MAAPKIVQTRIPASLLHILEKRAKAEGLSIAAYVRRLLIVTLTPQKEIP